MDVMIFMGAIMLLLIYVVSVVVSVTAATSMEGLWSGLDEDED